MILYFKPGEIVDVFFSESDTGILPRRKSELFSTGVRPIVFRLLVRMLYHRAAGDSLLLSTLKKFF